MTWARERVVSLYLMAVGTASLALELWDRFQ